MTRRKRELIAVMNEQHFPHLVELSLPPGGFRSIFLEIDAFHRVTASRAAAAGVGTRASNFIFVSASPMLPLRMLFEIALGASA